MPEQQGTDNPVRLRPRGIGHGTLFTNAVAYLFYCVMPLFFDVRWHGLENYHASPSTLITVNHKRDFDIMLVPPVLHIKRTAFRDKLRMYFVARDDLFEKGYLTGHLAVNWPWPVGNIIHQISLGPIVRAFSAYPMSSVINKRFGQLINEVMSINGDMRLSAAVKDDYIKTLASESGMDDISSLGNVPLSDVMSYKYHTLHDLITDTGVLKADLARKVRVRSLQQVEGQLQVFARILRDGGICLLTPEGQLSLDGRFWPVKSGLYRLVNLAGTPVTILPVNTTYDFMTTGRIRVYIAVGKEILLSEPMTKVALEQMVQRAVVNLGRVTMGQIGCEYLLWRLEAGRNAVSEAELADALSARALVLKNFGLNLDERLTNDRAFHRRLRQFVAIACVTTYCLERLQANTQLTRTVPFRHISASGGRTR